MIIIADKTVKVEKDDRGRLTELSCSSGIIIRATYSDDEELMDTMLTYEDMFGNFYNSTLMSNRPEFTRQWGGVMDVSKELIKFGEIGQLFKPALYEAHRLNPQNYMFEFEISGELDFWIKSWWHTNFYVLHDGKMFVQSSKPYFARNGIEATPKLYMKLYK